MSHITLYVYCACSHGTVLWFNNWNSVARNFPIRLIVRKRRVEKSLGLKLKSLVKGKRKSLRKLYAEI